jgi:hypothetical protein
MLAARRLLLACLLACWLSARPRPRRPARSPLSTSTVVVLATTKNRAVSMIVDVNDVTTCWFCKSPMRPK